MRLVLHNCTFDVSFKKILKWLIDIFLIKSRNSLTKRQKHLEFRYFVKRSVTLTSLETNIIVVTST